jgi:hypothetical protein
MVEEFILGKMEENMMVNINSIKNTVTVNISGMMEEVYY